MPCMLMTEPADDVISSGSLDSADVPEGKGDTSAKGKRYLCFHWSMPVFSSFQ